MIDLWARRAPIRFLSQRTIMTTLKSRLQLSLLNRKKGRNLLEKGFTLVELMIVIVIVGVLSGVALPNFLGTRNKADAQAQIGAMAGFAKLCSANMVNGDPTDIDVAATDVTITGTCDGAAEVTMALPAFQQRKPLFKRLLLPLHPSSFPASAAYTSRSASRRATRRGATPGHAAPHSLPLSPAGTIQGGKCF